MFAPLITIIAIYVYSLRRLQPTYNSIVFLCAQLPELLDLEALLELMILLTLAINLLPGSVWLSIQLSDLLDLHQMILFIKASLVVGRSLMSKTIVVLEHLIVWSGLIWRCTHKMALSEV